MKKVQIFSKLIGVILVLGLSLFIWFTATNFVMGMKNQNEKPLNTESIQSLVQKSKQTNKSAEIKRDDSYRKNLNSIAEKYLNKPLEGYSSKKENLVDKKINDKKKELVPLETQNSRVSYSTGISFIDMYFKDNKTKRDYIDIAFFSGIFILYILSIWVLVFEGILKINVERFFKPKEVVLGYITETSTLMGLGGSIVGILVLFYESSADFSLIKSNLGIVFSTTLLGVLSTLLALTVSFFLDNSKGD